MCVDFVFRLLKEEAEMWSLVWMFAGRELFFCWGFLVIKRRVWWVSRNRFGCGNIISIIALYFR